MYYILLCSNKHQVSKDLNKQEKHEINTIKCSYSSSDSSAHDHCFCASHPNGWLVDERWLCYPELLFLLLSMLTWLLFSLSSQLMLS